MSTQGVEGQGGGGHSTRLTGHHLVKIEFSKPVELPHDPINTPYGGNEDTHHILEIPLVKLPFLV
jgi:hypothetical protein